MSEAVMFKGRPWQESSPDIESRGPGALVHAGGSPSTCLSCGWRGVPNARGQRGAYRGMALGFPLFQSVAPRLSHVCPACGHADDYAEHHRLLSRRPIPRVARVGRNDPCPCESGRKFKKCCGATT